MWNLRQLCSDLLIFMHIFVSMWSVVSKRPTDVVWCVSSPLIIIWLFFYTVEQGACITVAYPSKQMLMNLRIWVDLGWPQFSCVEDLSPCSGTAFVALASNRRFDNFGLLLWDLTELEFENDCLFLKVAEESKHSNSVVLSCVCGCAGRLYSGFHFAQGSSKEGTDWKVLWMEAQPSVTMAIRRKSCFHTVKKIFFFFFLIQLNVLLMLIDFFFFFSSWSLCPHLGSLLMPDLWADTAQISNILKNCFVWLQQKMSVCCLSVLLSVVWCGRARVEKSQGLVTVVGLFACVLSSLLSVRCNQTTCVVFIKEIIFWNYNSGCEL